MKILVLQPHPLMTWALRYQQNRYSSSAVLTFATRYSSSAKPNSKPQQLKRRSLIKNPTAQTPTQILKPEAEIHL
jgi:hypothetical protein